MSIWLRAGEALLSLFLPERCLRCGAVETEGAVFFPRGPVLPGLRVWDRSHLCPTCLERLAHRPYLRTLTGPSDLVLPVAAGTRTGAELVAVLKAWKYHGVRGAAWPLAALAVRALPVALVAGGAIDGLVPVPLHRDRRRERGFNQADLLARLVAREAGVPCWPGIVSRRRRTPQQAKIPSGEAARRGNVRGAFAAAPAPERNRLGLIDDLVTSGATILAVAEALTLAGWRVRWALAVGMTPAGGRKTGRPAPGRNREGRESDLDSPAGCF